MVGSIGLRPLVDGAVLIWISKWPSSMMKQSVKEGNSETPKAQKYQMHRNTESQPTGGVFRQVLLTDCFSG